MNLLSNGDYQGIKNDLEKLRAKPVSSTVFGAESHGFVVNLPLTEEDLAKFESKHQVCLPEDYRNFLMLVGNGGAGPGYGLFKLGEMDDQESTGPWDDGHLVGELNKPFPYTEAWNDRSREPDKATLDSETYEQKLEEFDDWYWSSTHVDGAIPISHLGCALCHWLIVTGPQAGQVWLDSRADLNGLER